MYTNFLTLGLAMVLVLSSCSQSSDGGSADESIKVDRVNATATVDDSDTQDEMQAAKVSFKKQYPNAQNVSWGTDSNGYYEASFEDGGEKHRADYARDGRWIETESSLKWGQLPKAVQATIEKEFDKNDISELEKVNHAEKGLFYDIEFKKKGENRDVEIRENGEILK